jgi:hypothetical protein
MSSQYISKRTVGWSHPDFAETYCLGFEDGSIEIRSGLCSILMNPNGVMIIQAEQIKFLTDDLDWNNSQFNEKATNPVEPALTNIHNLLPSRKAI